MRYNLICMIMNCCSSGIILLQLFTLKPTQMVAEREQSRWISVFLSPCPAETLLHLINDFTNQHIVYIFLAFFTSASLVSVTLSVSHNFSGHSVHLAVIAQREKRDRVRHIHDRVPAGFKLKKTAEVWYLNISTTGTPVCLAFHLS